MAVIHQINCTTGRKNVGFGSCVFDIGAIAGCFLFDSPTVLNRSQMADLQNTLQTMSYQDIKATRCYPIHNFLNPQDNTEDITIETFSDGTKAFVRDGTYDWTFQITAGAFCLLQALRTHNGNSSTYAIFYDKKKQIIGYNNSGEFAAIPIMVFNAAGWKMNTGSNVTKYLIRFIFATNYVNEDAEYSQADFPLTNIQGLQDIKLQVNGWNHTTGVAGVTVMTECGGANLYDTYNAQLVLALWKASNAGTGSDIAITGVTPIPGSKTFNVALNTSDPDYPSSNAINLTLAAPSALSSGGIPGYEAEVASLTVVSS